MASSPHQLSPNNDALTTQYLREKDLAASENMLDLMKKVVRYRQILPIISRLLEAALCFPVGTATCERSFSCMRRSCTWLSSTMSPERLKNKCIIAIHKDHADGLLEEENMQRCLEKLKKQKTVWYREF